MSMSIHQVSEADPPSYPPSAPPTHRQLTLSISISSPLLSLSFPPLIDPPFLIPTP